MRRFLVRSLPLAIAAIVTATGMLTAAAPARAEFENERHLYLLMRVELENAQAMEQLYQRGSLKMLVVSEDLERNQRRRWSSAGCWEKKPGSAERCRQIENEYRAVLSDIITRRRGYEAAAFFQSLEVDRLRNEFNTAVANYVAQVALQAAVLPPAPEVGAASSEPRSQVRRRPPGRRATPGTRRRSNDLDRILRETQRRLQGLQ